MSAKVENLKVCFSGCANEQIRPQTEARQVCIEGLFYKLLRDFFGQKALILHAMTNFFHGLCHFFTRGVREGHVKDALGVVAGGRGGFGYGFAKVLWKKVQFTLMMNHMLDYSLEEQRFTQLFPTSRNNNYNIDHYNLDRLVRIQNI